MAARVVMHKLEPAAGHMDAVAAKLEDSFWPVRIAAVEMLGKLEPAALAQHGAALAARLEDPHEYVRYALCGEGCLELSEGLAPHPTSTSCSGCSPLPSSSALIDLKPVAYSAFSSRAPRPSRLVSLRLSELHRPWKERKKAAHEVHLVSSCFASPRLESCELCG